ncbi:MAG: hypothetical protein WBL35_02720 [Ornithinibacter sp.]
MSQLAPARPYSRPAARRTGPVPRSLRVVTAPDRQGNAGFVALCVALLMAGFIGVLMLNTAMAKGSYTMRDLQQRSDELTDSQDALRHSIDAVSGPGPLAKRAQSLGMVPAETPAFLRLSDGAVLGVAKAAEKNDRFSVVTETAPAPTKAVPEPTETTPPATASTFLTTSTNR